VSECGTRASDRERESAAKALREAYAAGRLSLDEFNERTDVVFAATTWRELGEVTADLPEGEALSRRAFFNGAYHQGLEVNHQGLEVSYEPKRPFGQVWATVVIWLAIAVVAHVFAAIPLVLLSGFVLLITRPRRRPPQHPGGPAMGSGGLPPLPPKGPGVPPG
jgi:hypothetical protein